MTIADVLDQELIKVPLKQNEKRAVIEELVDVLVSKRHLQDREKILEAVLARELLGSTGLTDGIAVPHAKTDAVDRVTVVVGISPKPIEFGAQDGKGCQAFFLVLAPEGEANNYIEVLASIARAVTVPTLRRMLFSARSADEVLRLFFD